MNVYLDSSVVLRKLLTQPHSFEKWGQWDHAWTSVLASVECLRTIDRLRVERLLTDDEVASTFAHLRQMTASIEQLTLTTDVLQKASDAYPTTLDTLDAIHVASALLLQEDSDHPLIFVTHDKQQGIAARAVGFRVEGI